MKLRIQSSTYPEPQTFNQWQAFLKAERERIYNAKIGRGNEDLIDIERD